MTARLVSNRVLKESASSIKKLSIEIYLKALVYREFMSGKSSCCQFITLYWLTEEVHRQLTSIGSRSGDPAALLNCKRSIDCTTSAVCIDCSKFGVHVQPPSYTRAHA